MLNGCTLQVTDENGDWIIDDSFLLMVNAADQGVEFTLPQSPRGKPWKQIMNTENIDDPFVVKPVDGSVIVGGRALKLLSDEGFHLERAQTP
jgi:isoamylase